MKIEELNSFLKFGYFLNFKNTEFEINFKEINKSKYDQADEDELLKTGINLWKNAIQSIFESNAKHVVPLSGGLDSRAILATLLEFTDAKNISTYTFGTPKTFDFEIGKKIALKAGTKHTQIPLTEYEYNSEELINISKRICHQTLLFLHPPVTLVDELFSDHNVWSGTIIDVFFGRHTHKRRANDWKTAMLNSFRENIFVSSTDLTNVEDKNYFQFVDIDEKAKEALGLEHIIDLLNRQLKFIAPHVLMKGYEYKLLFTNTDLTNFALSLDEKYIDNQYLYKKMFLEAFQGFFSLPTKTNFGLPLTATNAQVYSHRIKNKMTSVARKISGRFLDPNINYIDFNHAIRNRTDLRNIIYQSIMDLKSRKLLEWIDIDNIWQNHITNKKNHADALITLASLEIHLKAGLNI